MKIVGLTGGIGSGKSTVAQLFEKKGIPTYNSDLRAKFLMNNDLSLQKEIKSLLGNQAYDEKGLSRKWIAKKVFDDPQLLQKLNEIVHPAVKKDFEEWVLIQKTPYVLKEAAILIESGAYKGCDKIIVVTAELENRVKRLLLRDNSTVEEIQKRIQNQMSEKERLNYADYIIINDTDLKFLELKVLETHKEILKLK
ncbi:dephospho-CoA kinase [Flavobacteriaceae bacterium UJ101]|nr:dephospho-CoA kinase [Flavobacteriaceae bacterium UJ101]